MITDLELETTIDAPEMATPRKVRVEAQVGAQNAEIHDIVVRDAETGEELNLTLAQMKDIYAEVWENIAQGAEGSY